MSKALKHVISIPVRENVILLAYGPSCFRSRSVNDSYLFISSCDCVFESPDVFGVGGTLS